jgi:hypothetical protein
MCLKQTAGTKYYQHLYRHKWTFKGYKPRINLLNYENGNLCENSCNIWIDGIII